MDAMRESKFAYWNALLTLNGILITVFSAVAIFGKSNKWFIFVLVFSSIVSSLLLILNYISVNNLYEKLGKSETKLSDEDKQKSANEYKAIKRRETIVQMLLFLEALIILVLFFLI
ncbi:MAG TPA: hypothetical protein VNN20_17400 [Thermodesulfobacteriota bacterium]|nr:hypothetical protein [Thermodesulfobacteriota bacterium]